MKFLFLFLQVVSALSLIGLVLLHSAKGEGLGSIGTQARVFATQKGLENGLNKLTGVAAFIFFASSLILSLIH